MFLPPEHWSSGMILASGARGRGFNSPMLPFAFCKRQIYFFSTRHDTNIFCCAGHCAMCYTQREAKNTRAVTHDGTRTHNLALRRGTPYPFGHAGATGVQQPACTAALGTLAEWLRR